jgi:ABC-type multidrug transport system fused ATPase/permease subunit
VGERKGEASSAAARSSGAIVRRLLGLAWRYRAPWLRVILIQLVLLTLGVSGLSLTGVGIDFLRHIIQGAPAPTLPFGVPLPAWPPMAVLALIAGCILGLAGVRSLLNYTYAVRVNQLTQREIVPWLRARVYDKLQQLSFRFFDENSTGSIIGRVTADVQSVRMFLDQVMVQSVIMLLSLAVYFVYMVDLHPGLTFACLVPMPLLALVSTVFSRRMLPLYARNRELADRMIQGFAESVQGVAVVKAFGREAESRADFLARNDAVLAQQGAIFWRLSLFSPFVGFLTRVQTAVLLGYGGWLVIRGELALGTGLVVFAGLLEQFSGQVNHVAGIANSMQQALIGARRVFEILDAPVEIRSAPDAVRPVRLRGDVRFEGVHFGYAPGRTVLHGIDLEVPVGRCVAILGATGAGKSTLMSLVPRFYDPGAGRVTIDGTDLRRLDVQDLRRNIGVVFQESFLFSHTVAANIAFGRPDATRAQVERAARIAAAHDFISTMPQGYDTVLGESGNTLSGGQRQRLALARAILLEPPILLLDDPTAAIDPETEHEIFAALERAIAGRTTFIVAHRLSTLRRADFVIVMENGRIVQRGTHAELMRRSGPYQRVADLQLVDAGRGFPRAAEGAR